MFRDWKLFLYWWHRWRHEVMLFWDLFHQMHHSPKRVVTLTAYYVHPAEVVISSMLNGAIIYGVLGGSYEGFLWSAGIFSCVGIGYHSNLKTPRFMDYLIQTPEMHRLHHKRGVHEGNYSDLPIWDILFGTFRNPKDYGLNSSLAFATIWNLSFSTSCCFGMFWRNTAKNRLSPVVSVRDNLHKVGKLDELRSKNIHSGFPTKRCLV